VKKLLSLFLLLFLSGCGYRYNSRSLKHVKKSKADFIAKKEEVELRVKQLGPKKISRLFNGQRLNSKRIVQVLLTVKNDSNADILFDEKSIGLKLLTAKEVSLRLSRAVGGRVVAGVAAGVVAWPILVMTGAVGALLLGEVLFGMHGCAALGIFATVGGSILFAGFPVIVASTGYSVAQARRFNKKLANDVKCKVISKQIIPAHKKQSALLFTEDVPKEFGITLFKGEQGTELNFNVILKGAKWA